MEDNNLTQILKTLSKKELLEFELFIYSPFFNKTRNVIKLFEALKVQYPKFEIKTDKAKLYQKIYPKVKYNDGNMKTMFYLLTRLAEKYLIYLHQRSDTYDSQKRLLESFYLRKLSRQFIKLEKNIESGFSAVKGTDVKILNEKIAFENIRRNYYIDMNEEEKIYKHELKLGEHQITLFFLEVFKLYNSLKRLKYLSFDTGFDFVTEMMSYIDLDILIKLFRDNAFEDTLVIETYFYMYKALSEPGNDTYFNMFKQSFLDNAEYISKDELYILSTLLVSCSYYRQLNDRVKYTPELFESYKILLGLYIHSDDLYLRSTVYTNILRLGIQLKEFKWLENYIKEYSELLQPEHKENLKNYSNAYLSFAKNEFESALGHMSKVDFTTFQMKYHLRNLQLMTYYELSDYESAITLIDAYKHFIKKEKNFSKKLKDEYLGFIEYTYELLKIKTGSNQNYTGIIKNKIINSNPMRKQWLLEKIEELEK